MQDVLDALPADERKLLEVVREIKRRVGFGTSRYGLSFVEAGAEVSINARRIHTIYESYTHKLT